MKIQKLIKVICFFKGYLLYLGYEKGKNIS